MKRILSLILALVLMIPAFALGEDQEHIVGLWYFAGNTKDFIDTLPAQFSNVVYMIILLNIEADGTIRYYEIDLTANDSTFTNAEKLGQWTKKNGVYSASVIGVGEKTVYLNATSGEMRIMMVPGVYYNFYKATEMNWFNDLIPEAYIPVKGW